MTDWRAQEECEERRWHEERPRWFCTFCGDELPNERAACCGEVGCAESQDESEKRWAKYNEEFNHDPS